MKILLLVLLIFRIDATFLLDKKLARNLQRVQINSFRHSTYLKTPELFHNHGPIIKKDTLPGYSVCYNGNTYYTSEVITKKSLIGPKHRRPIFRESFNHNSKLCDYASTNTENKGHLAAAGNHKSSKSNYHDTFNLNNAVPQNILMNSGIWNDLEIYCRSLTNNFDFVNIITGPLFLPIIDSNGEKYIKFRVLGETPVPTHLFKVALVVNKDEMFRTSFVIPNVDVGEQDFHDFHADIKMIEKASGLKFHQLDTGVIKDVDDL